MTKLSDKAYILPDNIDPDNDKCIRVYVPDEPEYIAAFWGAYEYLTAWLAWERDTQKRGKQAAARWKESFLRAREEYLCSGGKCGIMDARQSSSVPCHLEKQTNCDGSWDVFADMRLCVPRMRIHGGVLQQDTTGTGNWVDAGDPETPYDPRFDNPIVPPWPDPPPGESGECLSAANVAAYVDFASYHFAASMVDGLTFFQTLSAVMTILAALMGIIPLSLLTAAITALYEQVVDNWTDVRDFSLITDLTEILFCRYEYDGSMTRDNWELVVEDITSKRESLSDDDQRAKWWIALQLVTLWGPVGMSLLGGIWGIDTYECTGDVCFESLIYDFELGSELGWVPYNSQSTVWDGTGWHDGYPSEKPEDGVSINSPVLPAIRIRKVELYLDIVMEGTNPSAALFRYVTSWAQWARIDDSLDKYTYYNLDWTTDGTTHRINVNIDEYFGGPNIHTDARIVKVIVYYSPL